MSDEMLTIRNTLLKTGRILYKIRYPGNRPHAAGKEACTGKENGILGSAV